MSESVLDAAQRAMLREVLLARRAQRVREMEALHGGESRVQHAREVLLQDGNDLTQRDADREVDLARTDQLARAISAVDAALDALYGIQAAVARDIRRLRGPRRDRADARHHEHELAARFACGLRRTVGENALEARGLVH